MKQKRFARMMAVLLLVVFLACMLTSCSKKLSGTYKPKVGIGDLGVITFDGEEMSMTIIDGVTVNGTYRIEGKEIYFTYTIDGVEVRTVSDFEKKGKAIFINGVEYEKQK